MVFLKYYQHKLGAVELTSAEMSSSLHTVDMNEDYLECNVELLNSTFDEI